MATSLLRIGRLSHAKCLQAERWITLSRTPTAAAFSSKSGPKKPFNKANPDKKQPNTYFDIEKLVQHKPYKFPKKDSCSPAASTTAAEAAVRATVSSATEPKSHAAAPEVVVTTSDIKTPTPVFEVNSINEPASAAEAKPAVESASKCVPAVEAIPVAEEVLESQPVGSSEPVSELAPTAEAAKAVVDAVKGSSVEAAAFAASDAEPAIAPTLDTETKPTAEAAAKVPVEEIVEDLSPGGVAPDRPTIEMDPVLVAEVAPAEVIPEPMIKEDPEPVVETAPVDVTSAPIVETAFEDSIPEPVAKDASVEVTTELKAEAAPEPMAEVEVAPELVAEAAPVEVTTDPIAEVLPVEVTTEPIVEAAPVDVTTEPVVEAAPVDVTTEPVVEAAPVDVTTEPIAEAAQEPVAEAAPVEGTLESLAEVSTTGESVEELIEPVPISAEAAGEELQGEATDEPVQPVEPSEAQMDPVQKLFLDSIRQYSAKSLSTGGLVDAGSEYEKALAEEIAKLQRLYGGGDLTSFPEFKFTEPQLDEVSPK